MFPKKNKFKYLQVTTAHQDSLGLDRQWEHLVSVCSLSKVVICLFFHLFLFKSSPCSRERKHRVTVLGFNYQKHLSEPKLLFPWSYVVHSYVPLDLGKFQYALACAALGLSIQLQLCNSTICNDYQRESLLLAWILEDQWGGTTFSLKIV